MAPGSRPAFQPALRVVIHTVGRPREGGWEAHAASEYARRLERGSPPVLARTAFHAAEDLAHQVARIAPPLVLLDEGGTLMTSEEFSSHLFGRLFPSSSRVSFVIGGASGLPNELREEGHDCISLGRLTFPHRVARVLLLEQLFRAREMLAESDYHQRVEQSREK